MKNKHLFLRYIAHLKKKGIFFIIFFVCCFLFNHRSFVSADLQCGAGSVCTGTNAYLKVGACVVNGNRCDNASLTYNAPHSCPTTGGSGTCVAFAPGKDGCTMFTPSPGSGSTCACSAAGAPAGFCNTGNIGAACGSGAPYSGVCDCEGGEPTCPLPQGGDLGCCLAATPTPPSGGNTPTPRPTNTSAPVSTPTPGGGGGNTPTPAPTSTPIAGSPRGWHDGANCNTIWGWTCDPNNYSTALTVNLYRDGPPGTGTFITSVIANVPRDIGVSGNCNGVANHGFEIVTPASLKDGMLHPIYAEAVNIGAGSNRLLSQTPITVQCAGPTSTPTLTPTPTPLPPVPSCTVSLSPAGALSMNPPNTMNLTATATTANGTVNEVRFSSTNATVASVTPAVDNASAYVTSVQANAAGSATVRADVVMSNGSIMCSTTKAVTVTTPPVANPTVTLTANGNAGSTTIAYNTAATLNWTSTNATSCTASVGWTGSKSITPGNESTGNLTANRTYTLTCQNSAGVTASATVTVIVTPPVPSCTVSLAPAGSLNMNPGNNVNLTATANPSNGTVNEVRFSLTNSTVATVTPTVDNSSPYVTNLRANSAGSTTVRADVVMSNGSIMCSTTKAVTISNTATSTPAPTSAPPTVNLTANGQPVTVTILYNTTAALSWSSTNATSCVSSGGWTGSRPTGGNASSAPLTSNTTFTIQCTGPGGTATSNVLVIVQPPVPSCTVSLAPAGALSMSPGNLTNLTATANASNGTVNEVRFSSTNATVASVTPTVDNTVTYTTGLRANALGSATVRADVVMSNGSIMCSTTKAVTVTNPPVANPTVTLTANGGSGSITIPYNTSALLVWSTTNAVSCVASGAWTGSRPISGNQGTGNLTVSQTYSLTCQNSAGVTAVATVSVIVQPQTATCSIVLNPAGNTSLAVGEIRIMEALVTSAGGTFNGVEFFSSNNGIAQFNPVSDISSPYRSTLSGFGVGSVTLTYRGYMNGIQRCQTTQNLSVVTAPAVCGNGRIEPGETCTNCPADVGSCVVGDPPICGNGTIQAGETCTNCPADVGACPPVNGCTPSCTGNLCGQADGCGGFCSNRDDAAPPAPTAVSPINDQLAPTTGSPDKTVTIQFTTQADPNYDASNVILQVYPTVGSPSCSGGVCNCDDGFCGLVPAATNAAPDSSITYNFTIPAAVFGRYPQYQWRVQHQNATCTDRVGSFGNWNYFRVGDVITGNVYRDNGGPYGATCTTLGPLEPYTDGGTVTLEGSGLSANVAADGTFSLSGPASGNSRVNFNPVDPNEQCVCPNNGQCQHVSLSSPYSPIRFFVRPFDVRDAWWQVEGGHIMAEDTVASQIPVEPCEFDTSCDPYLTLPGVPGNGETAGIVVVADTNPAAVDTSDASGSQSNQVAQAGNAVVRGSEIAGTRENYDYFYRSFSIGINPAQDTSIEPLANAPKPTAAPLNGRAYVANGNVTINNATWNVGAGENIVVFVDGDLNIRNDIQVAEGGFLGFMVSGDITIDQNVCQPNHLSKEPVVEGIYLADGVFTVESRPNGDCKFVGGGVFVGWSGVDLQRDFRNAGNQETWNGQAPTELFIYRPDLVFNMPDRMSRPLYQWQEVAP